MSHSLKTLYSSLILASCYLLQLYASSISTLAVSLVICFISIFALISTADVFTRLSTSLGDKIGLGRFAAGVLIVAVGTSAPESFSSIAAAMQNKPHMVVGNVLGTVIANTLLRIGLGALFSHGVLPIHKEVFGTQMSIFLSSII